MSGEYLQEKGRDELAYLLCTNSFLPNGLRDCLCHSGLSTLSVGSDLRDDNSERSAGSSSGAEKGLD